VKILLVTPMPPQPVAPGAIPLVLWAQLSGLARHHDVTLVTFVGPEAGDRSAVKQLRREGHRVLAVEFEPLAGLRRWRRGGRMAARWLHGRYPRRTVWFADPRIQGVIDGLVSGERFDIAAVEDNAMGMFRFPPALPSVLTEHEVRRPRPVRWSPGPWRAWARWAFTEADWHRWPAYQRAVWARFTDIQVFTSRDACRLAEVAPGIDARLHVNPFGVALPPAADPAREDPQMLLFVGNFRHAPNVDAARWLVSEVMPRLRSRSPQARLVVVGGGGREVLADQRGADGVEVAGEVADLRGHLDRAAVVLAPVRIGGGMRMKVLHALAAGKAVVTTTRGADGLIDPGRLPLLLAEDEDGIAQAAAGLLADQPLRRSLGIRARQFANQHHSPEAYAGRLETIYAGVIDRSSRPLG
jgi:glycosyltransferase involved in cell wall biosynthesis